MKTNSQDLLKPTVEKIRLNSIYSKRALLLATIFGGGLSLAALAAINNRYLEQDEKRSGFVWIIGVTFLVLPFLLAALEGLNVGNFGLRDGTLRIVFKVASIAACMIYFRISKEAYARRVLAEIPSRKALADIVKAILITAIPFLLPLTIALWFAK